MALMREAVSPARGRPSPRPDDDVKGQGPVRVAHATDAEHQVGVQRGRVSGQRTVVLALPRCEHCLGPEVADGARLRALVAPQSDSRGGGLGQRGDVAGVGK